MPRLGNPFPIRPNTIPINHCIRRHGAIGQEIIIAHPAIRFHDARCAEAIPRPRDRTPSRRHSAVRAKPIPRRTIVVPARLHRSAVIEEIPLAIDFAPTSRHCAVGIDHSKVPIALDKNRIHVFKRQNINGLIGQKVCLEALFSRRNTGTSFCGVIPPKQAPRPTSRASRGHRP